MMRVIAKTTLVGLAALVTGACVEVTPNRAWQDCKADPCSAACELELREVYCEGYPDDPKCQQCGLGTVEGSVDADEDASFVEPDAMSDGGEADGDVGTVGIDSGATDASSAMDTGVDVDAIVDSSPVECVGHLDCPVGKPRCEVGKCMACAATTDCQGRVGTPVCDATKGLCVECTQGEQVSCSASQEVCKAGGTECVQCNGPQECTAEATPRCGADNRCAACSVDADCERFGKVCDSGQCVQCTGKKTARCNGFVCNSAMRVCATGTRPESADFCEPCVSDAQCGKSGPALCMPTRFSTTETGYFCQPKLSAGETCIDDHRPYIGAALDAQQRPLKSIDGSSDASCKLRQTTCSALADFGTQQCSGPGDGAACGLIGQADGVCAAVPGQAAYRCSIPCGISGDCNLGSTCTPGGGACSL